MTADLPAAKMVLGVKVKILEMMEDMNDALFDSLPSLILEDEDPAAIIGGTKMMPAGAVGTLAGASTSSDRSTRAWIICLVRRWLSG